MHLPNQQICTVSGKNPPYPLDRYVNGYAVSVTFQPGKTGTYTLKQSFDNPYLDQNGNPYTTSYNASGVWLNFSDPVMVNASTNAVSNLAFIPRAIRVSALTKVSAGNPLTLTVIPMGMDGN